MFSKTCLKRIDFSFIATGGHQVNQHTVIRPKLTCELSNNRERGAKSQFAQKWTHVGGLEEKVLEGQNPSRQLNHVFSRLGFKQASHGDPNGSIQLGQRSARRFKARMLRYKA